MTWIRNEWLIDRDGQPKQIGMSLRNYYESDNNVRALVATWHDHIWIESDDMIIGLPTNELTDNYIILWIRVT